MCDALPGVTFYLPKHTDTHQEHIMRNATVTLDTVSAARAMVYMEVMQGFMGETVTFTYTSREGVRSTRTGVPTCIVGTPGTSTHAVKMDTDKGPRTFNLYLINVPQCAAYLDTYVGSTGDVEYTPVCDVCEYRGDAGTEDNANAQAAAHNGTV